MHNFPIKEYVATHFTMTESYLFQFLQKAHGCKTIEQLQKALDDVLKKMGVTNSAVMANYGDMSYMNVDKMKPKWMSDYMSEGLLEVDPFINRSKVLYAPVTWEHLEQWDLNTGEQRAVSLTKDHKLKNGIFVPLIPQPDHKSFLSIMDESGQNVKDLFTLYREQFISIGYAFHALAQPLLNEKVIENRKALFTKREKECLQWSAKGKSAWEVAHILSISERTVIFHLNNAKKKIGATSKAHLITKAIAGGYVDI